MSDRSAAEGQGRAEPRPWPENASGAVPERLKVACFDMLAEMVGGEATAAGMIATAWSIELRHPGTVRALLRRL